MASLVRDEPVLRARAVLAVVIFATLNVLWSSLALALSSAPRPLSNGAIGLFGVVGLAGAVAARRAGRLADRGLAHVTTVVASGGDDTGVGADCVAHAVARLARARAPCSRGRRPGRARDEPEHDRRRRAGRPQPGDCGVHGVLRSRIGRRIDRLDGDVREGRVDRRQRPRRRTERRRAECVAGDAPAALRPSRPLGLAARHQRDGGASSRRRCRRARFAPDAWRCTRCGAGVGRRRRATTTSWLARYGATTHDGITVTASLVATSLDQQVGAEGDRREPRRTGAGRDRQWHGGRPRLVVAVAEHEVHVGEVGGGETRPAGPRMAGASTTARSSSSNSRSSRTRLTSPVEFGDEGDVEAIVEEGGDRVVVGQRLEAQLGAGQPLVQRAHHVGHPLEVGGALRRQTERAPTAVGELTQVEAGGAQLARA